MAHSILATSKSRPYTYQLEVNGVRNEYGAHDMNILAYNYYMYCREYDQEGDGVYVIAQTLGDACWQSVEAPPKQYDGKTPIFLFKNGMIYYSDNNARCYLGGHIIVEKDMFYYLFVNGWRQKVYLSMDNHFLVDLRDRNVYKNTKCKWWDISLTSWKYVKQLFKEQEI